MTAPVDERLKPLPKVSAWLAAQHSEHQSSIANNLILALFPLWQIMRFSELDASTTLWLPSVLPRVETAFLQSQRLSAVFNANVRFAELPVDEPILMDVPEVEVPAGVPRWAFEMPQLVPADVDAEIRYALAGSAVQETPVSEVVPAAGIADAPVDDRLSPERNPFTPKWVLDRVRRLEDVKAGRVPRVELEPFNRADVAQSLTIEANYRTKAAMPGDERELMHDGLVRSSGAAVRQAMNGGRSVTNQVVQLDRKIIGFARVTDNDPCAFCALLASRGAVYGRGAFARSDAAREAERGKPKTTWALNPQAARDVPDGWTNVAKVHNNCQCHLRPVYANESRWDAAAQHFLNLWNDRWKDAEKSEEETVEEVLKRNPGLKGYNLQRAVDLKAFKRKLEANPFGQSQFDLNAIRDDLKDRMDGLLNAGFSPGSPQVQFAKRTSGLVT